MKLGNFYKLTRMNKTMRKFLMTRLQVWSHFLPYLAPYKRDYICGILPIPISVFCSIAFPWLIIQIIDQQFITEKWQGMGLWLSLISFVLIANYVSSSLYSYFIQKAALHSIHDLRQDMFMPITAFFHKDMILRQYIGFTI